MKLQLETSTGAILAALGVFVAIIGMAVGRQATAPSTPNATPQPTPSPYLAAGTLTFSDEFDGTSLSSRNWIDSYPDGVRTHANHEQQYYAPEGVTVRDGKLQLKAERRAQGGMPYTSGMVASYGKFAQKFGRFEIRAKFPKGKGIWPAFWLLPSTKGWPPEIDILEILGHDPTCIYFTNHWRGAGNQIPNQQGKLRGIDFSSEFHTIALDWTSDRLVWSVDGVVHFETREHVPQEPMYLLANLAVGGDWPGFPDSTTPFPAVMQVDYIRVYSQ